MKRIVLCADDYGQAQTISQGIISLIEQQRLSATSCLVTTSFWPEHAGWLKSHRAHVAVGLHLNLTEGRPLSTAYRERYGDTFFSLSNLLVKAFLGGIQQKVLEAEFEAQLDCFEAAMGILPDFLDGHQHVHQFPIVREAFIAVYQARLQDKRTCVRWVNPGLKINDIKHAVIYFSGTQAFKKRLDQSNMPYYPSFAGVYAFKQAAQYAQLFPRFLQEIGEGGLVMCHPGLPSADHADAIAAARYHEFQYFSSPQFLTDCNHAQVLISAMH